MGLETEFGVSFTEGGRKRLAPDEAARAMFRDIVRVDRSSNVFCENGARLYLDVGNHPEYATAECTDLRDLLDQDRAGELVMLDLMDTAERYLAEDGVNGILHLFKNNIDSAGNSYGCHENYMVPRSSRLDELSAALVPFLVTRQVTCGAGHLSLPPLGSDDLPRFCVSQRADVVWEGVSSATTRSRPMINTRDEPHAAAETHRRLHVIVGDSNMSEASTLLKVGSTELLLRFLESGGELPGMTLDSEAKAIRAISLDRNEPVKLADGRTITAAQVQRAHFDVVESFTRAEGYPGAHDRQVLELWDRVLTGLERDDLAALERDVDWVVKLRMIERFMDRSGVGIDDPRVAAIDLLFHDIRPGRGLFRKLEEAGAVTRITTEASARAAVDTPPPTRATVRGAFIRAARANGYTYAADWSHVRVSGRLEAMVTLLDPFASTNTTVDALIRRMSES
ncbi:MAG: Pup--protein ligase [Dermatophilus congolensis]|nr:Pup--protein ligase [Dermatophilus congolensis]